MSHESYAPSEQTNVEQTITRAGLVGAVKNRLQNRRERIAMRQAVAQDVASILLYDRQQTSQTRADKRGGWPGVERTGNPLRPATGGEIRDAKKIDRHVLKAQQEATKARYVAEQAEILMPSDTTRMSKRELKDQEKIRRNAKRYEKRADKHAAGVAKIVNGEGPVRGRRRETADEYYQEHTPPLGIDLDWLNPGEVTAPPISRPDLQTPKPMVDPDQIREDMMPLPSPSEALRDLSTRSAAPRKLYAPLPPDFHSPVVEP